jgi:hypothetical protein
MSESESIGELLSKNRKLLELQRQNILSSGSKIFKLLPQGPGSGLNADLLDGKHAMQIVEEAIAKTKVFSLGGGGGAGTLTITGLDGAWQTGSCSGKNPIVTAHGLGGTPSLVFYSVNALQPYEVSYNVDGTNITFYHNSAGSLTIKWAARL